jgi:hypothetical protein
MIDLKDLQKPATAVVVIGAVATAGFVAGYLVGRDPEMARGLVRSLAGGLTRLQVAAAEAWENLGDLWADARAQAQSEIEAKRFAAETAAPEPAQAPPVSATAALATTTTGATAAASRRERRTSAARKSVKKVANSARSPAGRRSPRRKTTTAVAT